VSKKRVLVVHPRVTSVGGGNALAAWALQALREDFEVDLATLVEVDYAGVNRAFGTSLSPNEFCLRRAPSRYLSLLRLLPTRGAELERVLTVRHGQNLDPRLHYDVLFSTYNEADFLRRGMQYIHYPAYYLPRPDIEMRWFHSLPGMLSFYRGFCLFLSRGTYAGPRQNLTLVNSSFVAERTRHWHQIDSTVLYPPVPGEFPDTPWGQRKSGLVAVGRLHPGKRWHLAVEIVEQLRARGHPLTLTVIGHLGDSPTYAVMLNGLAASRPWFRILHDLSRDDLAAEVARHRYGIHPMEEEHFGIAPAEIQRAGCIPFVHNSGGPVEIVGHELALTFGNVLEAVEKVERVLVDPALERRLRQHVAVQRERFSADRFCRDLRAIVHEFAESQTNSTPT